MDGPFVNLTLHINSTPNYANDCLTRSFNSHGFHSNGFQDPQAGISPHTAGRSAVGGTMLDVVRSPGDLLFFLRHPNLDHLWVEVYLELPSYAIIDYDGDFGNETTLNHNLWLVGIKPNATMAEVMDLDSDVMWAKYV